jgi:hypothetical protein
MVKVDVFVREQLFLPISHYFRAQLLCTPVFLVGEVYQADLVEVGLDAVPGGGQRVRQVLEQQPGKYLR